MTKNKRRLPTEICIHDFSGYGSEGVVWRIIRDIAHEVISKYRSGDSRLHINPFTIHVMENGGFSLEEYGDANLIFDAPEMLKGEWCEASLVWSLAASVFNVVMGCNVMNGKGASGQSENSKIPYMRVSMPELSELLQHCLCYNPAERPTMMSLYEQATLQYERYLEVVKHGPPYRTQNAEHASLVENDMQEWPEEMIDVNNNMKI